MVSSIRKRSMLIPFLVINSSSITTNTHGFPHFAPPLQILLKNYFFFSTLSTQYLPKISGFCAPSLGCARGRLPSPVPSLRHWMDGLKNGGQKYGWNIDERMDRDGKTYRKMDERAHGRTVWWTEGRINGRTDGLSRTNGRKGTWKEGQMEEDKWKEEQMEGRTDERV